MTEKSIKVKKSQIDILKLKELKGMVKILDETYEELGYDLNDQFGDEWAEDVYAELGDVIRELNELVRRL